MTAQNGLVETIMPFKYSQWFSGWLYTAPQSNRGKRPIFFITLDKHHCLYFVGLKGKKDHALQISRQVLIGSLDVPKLNIFSHAIPVLLTRAVWGPMHSMPRLFQDAPRFCLLQFIIRKSVIKVSGIPAFMVPMHP